MKTLYDPNIHPQLACQYARDGLIDKDICVKFGISVDTFYKWKKKHAEFAESLKRSKQIVDYEVENSLLKRALGYKVKEIKRTQLETKVEIKTINGVTTEIKTTPVKIEITEKEILPDVTACIFWLKNRKPDKWRDDPTKSKEGDTGSLDTLCESLNRAFGERKLQSGDKV